ncbi:MAG: Bax inhibitor-1/YccA family protein, partial [Bacillota bacterium]|nr:Bax inhibitor-1/YccA family protein [Bacillota bacterium]
MDRFNQYDELAHSNRLAVHMVRVYGWMFLGLIITAITAFVTVASPLGALVINPISLIILFLAEMGIVVFLSARIVNMSFTTASAAFIVYSVLNGLTLSLIFYVYRLGSVANVFFITALFFGVMSVYGAVTKNDLTKVGSILFMGFIGIIIASIVNFFVASTMLQWIISYAGVAVFLGLTAYDVQKIKKYYGAFAGTPKEDNIAIFGALNLYLDFINL